MNVTRRSLMILLALAIVLVAAIWTLGQGQGTTDDLGVRDQQQEMANRDPASIDDLKDAIEQAQQSIDQRDWDAARDDVRTIRQRWLSFKPSMRALAGTRMWSTTAMNAFENALNQAEDAVESRNDVTAHEAVTTMRQIALENDTTREGPPADPRIRGDSGVRR